MGFNSGFKGLIFLHVLIILHYRQGTHKSFSGLTSFAKIYKRQFIITM